MRLIDADALIMHLADIWLTESPTEGMPSWYRSDRQLAVMVGIEYAMNAVETAKTAVVTCQDCKYFAIKDYWRDFNGHPILATSDAPTCTKWGTGDCLTRPDGFCFIGERLEKQTNETD